jgi:hypothetical protein
MPLTPLPPSNTQRYFIGMLGGGHQHHIQVRCTEAITPAQAAIDLGFAASALQPGLHQNYSFNELLHAELGSDIRNPVPSWEVLTGLITTDQPADDHPRSLCARGRSTTGRKARAFLWGMNFARTADWLITPDVGTPLGEFLAILVATPSYFLAIDGTKPVWKLNYAIGFNDHWIDVDRP